MAACRVQPWLGFANAIAVPRWTNILRRTCPIANIQQTGARRFRPRHHTRCCAVQSIPSNADSILRRTSHEQGLDVNQINALLRLVDLLLSENKRYNLTAIRDRDAVLVKHIIDALSLLPIIDPEKPKSILDVGTGAGFPGLVLAIARPEWHVTLLDSARKKTQFHDVVQSQLGLANIHSEWARAEEAGQSKRHRERYDVVVARSVAEMRVLCELCLPLVAVKGCFLAQKSVDASQSEILDARTAMKILGGRLETVSAAWPEEWTNLVTKGDERDEREKSVVSIRKQGKSPSKYPRSPGVPKKTPL